MSKQSLLLVDGDTRSLRVLEVSLRKAGFSVTPASSVQDALDKLDLRAPDLIISETMFPEGDGFELRRRVRAAPDWAEIPFIFLTAEVAIENKIRGLELGVDDYLTKPIYIKEIVTRINILLQKRQRLRFEERKDGRTRFAGRVADMPVVDVIQTIEISRKSGVIQFVGEHGRQAAIYFRDGKVIDAEAGTLQGEDAVYRLLTWTEGDFEVVFRTVRRREVIQTSSQGLLMEGMRRLDEWSRLLEQLPPLTHRFEIDTPALSARLGEIPDDNNRILRQFDGKRSLIEVLDASDFGDLECLQAVSQLYFEDMLIDLDHDKRSRRITGKAGPLVEIEGSSPIEDAASGPLAMSQGLQTAAPSEQTSARLELLALANTQPVLDSQLMSEESARVEAAEPNAAAEQPGGFRVSSLRLIDDAIAAAQALDPALYEEPSSTHQLESDVTGAATSGISVPETINDEPSPSAARIAKSAPTAALHLVPPSDEPGREDSGLRMIGSLGRDRAEASGELQPVSASSAPANETQREFVTILPRRITREMQVVQPPPHDPPSAEAPRPAAPIDRPPERSARPSDHPIERPSERSSGPLDRPFERPSERSSRSLDPRGSRAVSQDQDGASMGGIILLAIGVLLAGTAALLWLRGDDEPGRGAPTDAPLVVMTLLDAPLGSGDPGSAPHDAGSAPHDASASVVVVDGGRAQIDAAVAAPDAGGDPGQQAKRLYQSARDANQEGDFTKALELADASLALRPTARGHIVRAQALQRLGRIDDALRTLDAAQRLAPTYATVFEVRGNILWAARRWDAAHDAYNQYLELDQDSARAEQIRARLLEPH